jgi:membrane protease YdiL (CAAX protease family)
MTDAIARQERSSRSIGGRSRPVRYAVAAGVVAAWISLGFLFRFDVNTYLLLGVPIALLFQALVRRQPIRALWLRDAPPFRLDPLTVLLFAGLVIMPLYTLLRGVNIHAWSYAAYGAVSVPGAFAAAYAVRAMDRPTARKLMACLATAGALGIAFVLLGAVQRHGLRLLPSPLDSAREFAQSILVYVPAVFVLEEVFFRGALDGYVQPGADPKDYTSAFFVAGLWGLWHLPVTFPLLGWAAIPSLLALHLAVGVPLSIWWRRSGNLAVPGLVHALLDAVRNALML